MGKNICITLFSLFISLKIANAQVVIDTTGVFVDKQVSNTIMVLSNDTLVARRINVIPNGHLTLIGGEGVVVDCDFEVGLGGILEIYGGNPFAVKYIYDACGNRTQRRRQ